MGAVTDTPAGKRVLIVGGGDVAEHTVRRLAPFDVTTTRTLGSDGY